MTQPAPPDDGIIHATVALADTPLGQKVALTLLVLLPKDAAAGVAEQVTKMAGALSGAGLAVAAGNGTAPEGGG